MGRKGARHWTPAEEFRLVGCREEGWSWERIGAALGRTAFAVKYRYYRRLCSPPTDYSLARLARALGVSDDRVRFLVRRGHLEAPPSFRRRGLGAGERAIPLSEVEWFLADPECWHLVPLEGIRDPAMRAYAEAVRVGVRFLTAAEVGARLGYSRMSVHRLVRGGVLPALRTTRPKGGRLLLFREADVEAAARKLGVAA